VHIESSLLELSPKAEVKWHRDTLDNSVALVQFQELSERVSILSEVIIRHYEERPFNFLIEPYAQNYPFFYEQEDLINLGPFFQPVYPQDASAISIWLGNWQLSGSPRGLVDLLVSLNQNINQTFAYTVREEPGVQHPAKTLADRRGSCRDYSALFMEACRQLGIASRFVSGYLHAPTTEIGGAATHAWAEVYIPGAGWKGFDPTIGEMTGSKHIAVAVARHPENVPPVAGSYIGNGGAIMSVSVQVNQLENLAH
jgi:transglutaminase-like putative cysteine protease